ncbi:ADP ribosylation factor like GTPase 3, like 1 isoform X1 [Cottoperca gobio]|uniref:ADP ribosylation factor like GTPase 3, like 1 isoform X1 n=1 Tax=Cottoperca gobio TaxID=56716 RepID=A0A6J2QHX7_COTGO|nr:uncharacterized protein LOC115014688 isoform X1 [Cottoperca gobio]
MPLHMCLLLYSFFILAGAGATCVPVNCLRCNTTEKTQSEPCTHCSNNLTQCISDIPSDCKKDFQVSVNSTGSKLQEGDAVNLTCVHNLPDLILTFVWKREGMEILRGQNKSVLFLEKVLTHCNGQYICFVKSLCGDYESAPHDVTVENKFVVTVVICGVSALVLVLVLGMSMKFKLRRDNIKHKERLKQKALAEQRAASAPFPTPET